MMDNRKIRCHNCQRQIMVPPVASRVYCNNCQTMILRGTTEGQIINCKATKGCFRKFIKENFPGIGRGSGSGSGSSLEGSSPQQRSRVNPMDSIAGHQSKKAVLCGVSYKDQKYMLKGTINDVNKMRALLMNPFGFPNEAICILTEEDDPNLLPTKKNMEKALRWLVKDCRSGDSLVFYFSGHGLRQPDFTGDELDGFDETLCPVDFIKEGMILDNDINAIIVKPLPSGVKLHAIIDACHSGTVLDLEWVYDRKLHKWTDNRPPSGVSKKTSGGLAICLSACADSECAADTNALSGNAMSGAMTYVFIEAITNNPNIKYGTLLGVMEDRIEAVNSTGCFNSRVIRKVFRTKAIPKPLLSSSTEFNVDTTEFKL